MIRSPMSKIRQKYFSRMFYFHSKSPMTWHHSKCKCTMWQSYPDRHPRTVLYSTHQRHSCAEPKNQPQNKKMLYKDTKITLGVRHPTTPHTKIQVLNTNSQPVVAQWWLDRALCAVLPSTGRCFRGAVGWLVGWQGQEHGTRVCVWVHPCVYCSGRGH